MTGVGSEADGPLLAASSGLRAALFASQRSEAKRFAQYLYNIAGADHAPACTEMGVIAMSTPTEIVTAFLSAWEKPSGFADALRDYFTAGTVWENVGMSKTTGPEEAMGVFAGFGSDSGMLTMRVDTLAIAATGDKVLTERVDHVLGADGKPVMSIPVMGAFEVKDGKITAWRDYFDTAAFQQQGSSG